MIWDNFFSLRANRKKAISYHFILQNYNNPFTRISYSVSIICVVPEHRQFPAITYTVLDLITMDLTKWTTPQQATGYQTHVGYRFMVVDTSACPSSSWTVRMSYPFSRRCVAKAVNYDELGIIDTVLPLMLSKSKLEQNFISSRDGWGTPGAIQKSYNMKKCLFIPLKRNPNVELWTFCSRFLQFFKLIFFDI